MNDMETQYFKDSWKPDYDKFEYSGWKLLQQIRPKDEILDIGCGYNLFKDKLGDRVYGIDPANDKADQMIAWEDYTPIARAGRSRFNVYLALGSLNFGTEQEVEAQIKKLSEVTEKGDRIYWRQNPGIGDPPWKGVENVRFYPWTIEKNYEWADKYGFWVRECREDTGNRIYAEWFKGNELEYYAYKVQD